MRRVLITIVAAVFTSDYPRLLPFSHHVQIARRSGAKYHNAFLATSTVYQYISPLSVEFESRKQTVSNTSYHTSLVSLVLGKAKLYAWFSF
jgi:hypothetical protein